MPVLPSLPHTVRIEPSRAAVRARSAALGQLVCTKEHLLAELAPKAERPPMLDRLGQLSVLLHLLPEASRDAQLAPAVTERARGGREERLRLAADLLAAMRLLAAAELSPAELDRVLQATESAAGDRLLSLCVRRCLALCRAKAVLPYSDGLALALRAARSPRWPQRLARVDCVEFGLGCELDAASLLLLQAVAAGGRRCVVEAPAALGDGGKTGASEDPSMGPRTALSAQARAYSEAMLARLESLGQADIDVRFVEPPPPAQATAVWQAGTGAPFVARVVDEVMALAGSGDPTEVALVLPPAHSRRWPRQPMRGELERQLADAGLPVTVDLPSTLRGTRGGQFALDVLQLACELEAGEPPSLAIWGRVEAQVAWGEGRPAPPWPWGADTEAVVPSGLATLLVGEQGLDLASAEQVAAEASLRLARLTEPLRRAPTWQERVGALARVGWVAMPGQENAATEAWQAWLTSVGRVAAESERLLLPSPGVLGELTLLADALARAPVPAAQRATGVRLLEPEGLIGGQFDHVVLVAPHDDLWFRPPGRPSLLSAGLCVALEQAYERPLRAISVAEPRGRGAWLWEAAERAARIRLVACLQAPEGGALPVEPACQAMCNGGPEDLSLPGRAPAYERAYGEQQSLSDLCDAAAWRGHHALLASTQATERAPWRLTQHARRRPAAGLTPGRETDARRQAWLGQEHATTALDLLMQCRFRYAATHVWQLGRPPPPAKGASPSARGQALHRALQDLVGNWQTRAQAGDASPHPDRLAAAQARYWREEHRYLSADAVHPALRRTVLAQLWPAVEEQLEQLWQRQPVPVVATEVAFGTGQRLPGLELDVSLEAPVRVRGSIDRVDLTPALCSVFDYKSTRRRRVAGRHLQLGLYGLVAAQHVAEGRPLLLAWLPLQGPAAGRVELPPEAGRQSGQGADAAQLRADVTEVLERQLKPFLAGDWQPDPDQPATCKHCHFADLCQHASLAEGDAEPVAEEGP